MDSQLQTFFGTWIAPELTLLRYRLSLPYCLGHSLLLEAIDSPFVHLGDPEITITPADLLIALRICSQTRWPFDHPRFRPTAWTRFQGWYLGRNHAAFRRACDLFVEWIRVCGARPEYWQDEGSKSGGGLTAPEQLIKACELLRKAPGLTEERIWSMPIGLVDWYYGAICEQEGAGNRFTRDSDLEEPEAEALTEEQVIERARRQLGPRFEQWLSKRKEALSRG